MQSSNIPHPITEKHLNDAEIAAIEALAKQGVRTEDIEGYQVTVSDNGLVMWHGKGRHKLEGAAHDENVKIAYTGAMLWACCRYARDEKNNNHWKLFEIGREIGRMVLALQFPEISQSIIEDFKTKQSTNAANSRHDKTTRPLKIQAILWADELKKASPDRSPRSIAKELHPKLKNFAKSNGYPYSTDDPYGTLYGWLRNHFRP